ncbi:MAG: tetratricopeptide repeat protein [Polyangia bacterium]
MHEDESTDSLILRARQLADGGQLAEALRLCQERAAQEPPEVSVWNLLAELQAESGQRQESLASFYRAAQLLFEKGASERAIAANKQVLDSNPHDVEANLCLAALYRQQGQVNRAALAYEMAAQALATRGWISASLTVVRMIIDMSPDNVARRLRLADQYTRADRIEEAVHELEAAAAYLEGTGRSDDQARVAERLRALQAERTHTHPPAGARDVPAPHRAPAAHEEDASSLIAEADSFLRLGLLDKATEHLAAALSRNPFLRRLRDALIRLYVAQGQTKQAVAEIWALLAQCQDRQEEFRYLRYILRLDSQDQAARQQLERIRQAAQTDAASRSDTVPALSMARVRSELRSALDSHRPPTDRAVTSVLRTLQPGLQEDSQITDKDPDSGAVEGPMSEVTTQRIHSSQSDEAAVTDPQLLPSATTRPGVDEVEAIAEELALSSRTFREELAQVEQCVRQGNYADALHNLHVLAASYPHSNVVWAQLDEIERAQRKQDGPAESQQPVKESSLTISTEIASALRSLKSPGTEPSQTTPTLGTLLSGAKQDLLHTTLEVDPADITEERIARGAAQHGPPGHHRHPPQPPRRLQTTGAAAAFKSGVLLRARRQYEEAIMELERALAEPSLRTRATYLIGLCYLDDQHTAEAISWLMRGVNTPQASEAELSELFYALGQAHDQGGDVKEAILCFQLSLGPAGRFRDAAQRMAALQQALRRT